MAFALPVFWFMGSRYEGLEVVLPFLGSIGWIWWYMMCAIFISLTLTKVIDKVKKK
ncbi:MAG: hypothetical protein GOV15_00580 [Candidatus Diapherotrites archaeon]|nr:hypothetical protein [Candidatus Diapherotrites archaeon]